MEESRHLLGIELLIELSLAFPRLCHVEVFAAISSFSSRTLPIEEEKFVGCFVRSELIERIDGTLLKQSHADFPRQDSRCPSPTIQSRYTDSN